MICELATAAGPVYGKAVRVEEILITGARARSVERGMLKEPYGLGRLPLANSRNEAFHARNRLGIIHEARSFLPAYRWRQGLGVQHVSLLPQRGAKSRSGIPGVDIPVLCC